jgi:hypothetical protein
MVSLSLSLSLPVSSHGMVHSPPPHDRLAVAQLLLDTKSEDLCKHPVSSSCSSFSSTSPSSPAHHCPACLPACLLSIYTETATA